MFPQGLSPAGEAHQDSSEAARLQISRAATLLDLSGQYAFYTEALLHTKVRLGRINPYADFLAGYGRNVDRISLRFALPLFAGLEVGQDPEWNYVLYGMPLPDWSFFLAFSGQLAFHDAERQLLTRIRTQQLAIPDPLFLARTCVLPKRIPVVTVTGFVLDTSRGCTYFRPGAGLLDPWRVHSDPRAYRDTQVFARSLTGDAPQPYAAIDADCAAETGRPAGLDDLLRRAAYE